MREDCPERFLGCLSFLCQILGQLRSGKGEPFHALMVPVFEALELLIDDKAGEVEMTCAVVQVCGILKYISFIVYFSGFFGQFLLRIFLAMILST